MKTSSGSGTNGAASSSSRVNLFHEMALAITVPSLLVGSGFEVDYGFVTMVGGERSSLGSVSAAGCLWLWLSGRFEEGWRRTWEEFSGRWCLCGEDRRHKED